MLKSTLIIVALVVASVQATSADANADTRVFKTANNGYDQFGNPIQNFNNKNSDWHHTGWGSSNLGLNAGNTHHNGVPGGVVHGNGNTATNVHDPNMPLYPGMNNPDNIANAINQHGGGQNQQGFHSSLTNTNHHGGSPPRNDCGIATPLCPSGRGYAWLSRATGCQPNFTQCQSNGGYNGGGINPGGIFGGNNGGGGGGGSAWADPVDGVFGGGGGGFGAATTVLDPATGQQTTISDSTLQACRQQNFPFYDVTMDQCTSAAVNSLGAANVTVPMTFGGGGGFGGSGGLRTREGEPECLDAAGACVPSVCQGTPGMAGNTNLAPGFIAPNVRAECTDGNRCVSFTDASQHECPTSSNYRACCELGGFTRGTWIAIGVSVAAFVLIVVVAVSIRARNIGRSAEMGNMRSLMYNMDSSDSSIFLSNSIQRNPARY